MTEDPKPKRPVGRPPTGHDHREYNRLYMHDKRQADKLGMTVKEYRAMKEVEE